MHEHDAGTDPVRQANIEIMKQNREIVHAHGYELGGSWVPLPGTWDEFCKSRLFLPSDVTALAQKLNNTMSPAMEADYYGQIDVSSVYGFQHPSDFVINFTRPQEFGAGYLEGETDIESALCRQSTLHMSIDSLDAKILHEMEVRTGDISPLSMLLSPCVVVFRDVTGALLRRPKRTCVLSVPVPAMDGKMPREMVLGMVETLTRNALCIAASRSALDITIDVGEFVSWGYEIQDLCTIFHHLLTEDGLRDWFSQITIATRSASPDADNVIQGHLLWKQGLGADEHSYVPFEETDSDIMDLMSGAVATFDFDFPVCNHHEGITDRNIGYCAGALLWPFGASPFEAEKWKDEEGGDWISMCISVEEEMVRSMTVVRLPSEEDEPIVPLPSAYEGSMAAVLDLGMTILETEHDVSRVAAFLKLLSDANAMRFLTPLAHGMVQYCRDRNGTFVVCVSAHLRSQDRQLAQTPLIFRRFPTQRPHASGKIVPFRRD